MATKQPVKPGLSAPIVTSIPNVWSAAWFRSFITNYLQNIDLKNAAPGGVIAVTGNGTQPPTVSFSPISAHSVLGNPNNSAATPTALNSGQLTGLINTFTTTLKGSVPAPLAVRGFFLRDDGTWAPIVIPPSAATAQPIEILYNEITLEDQWPPIIPSNLGPTTFNGPVTVTIGATSATGAVMAVTPSGAAVYATSLNGTVAVQINSNVATNRATGSFSQAGTIVTRFGADGSQTLASDSINGDLVYNQINGGTIRWTAAPNNTAIPSQMTLGQTGALGLRSSPLAATVTQAHTGLANFKVTLSTANSTALTADAALTVTCNETGWYDIDVFVPCYESTSGAGGFQFDLNGGTATIANFVAAPIASTALQPGITSIATAVTLASVSTNSAAPSWISLVGTLQVTVAGTIAVRWAQAALLAIDPTTLMAGARIVLTKIG